MTDMIPLFFQSTKEALLEIVGNPLRSLLTVLSVAVGVFCVIATRAAVDSLGIEINENIGKLGSDVIYVEKFPWGNAPGSDINKFRRRPYPDIFDWKYAVKNLQSAEATCLQVFVPSKRMKYEGNEVLGMYTVVQTKGYDQVFNPELQEGRFFNELDYSRGLNNVVIGANIAESLFGGLKAENKKISYGGRKFNVIGVMKKEGENLIQILPYDDAVLFTYRAAKNMYSLENDRAVYWKILNVKAKPDVVMDDLKQELIGSLRISRKLKPKEENDFAVNEMGLLTEIIDQVLGILSQFGWVIGFFSLLVGMFSIANIMFVSVKERTRYIGIKKAIGASGGVILVEFLIEAIFLCFIGALAALGALGLLIGLARLAGVHMVLTTSNIIFAITLSVIIGLISGFMPARRASKLPPVEAIRS